MPAAVTRQTPKGGGAKPKTGIAAKIQPMEDFSQRGYKINLYGRSGTGKTTLWATFPGKILAVIMSGGKQPGELMSINTPEYRKKIDQIIIQEPAELIEVAKYLAANPTVYKTAVADHVTGLQDLVLKQVLELDEIPVQYTWGLASQQQWGQIGIQVKEYLRLFLNLPQHVVLVAQERDFNTDGDAASVLAPYVASALSPSVVGWLNPAVDYICQTFIRQKMKAVKVKIGNTESVQYQPAGGVEYCLRTAPHDVFTTKFRIPKGSKLPDEIVDPTFAKIDALLKGK